MEISSASRYSALLSQFAIPVTVIFCHTLQTQPYISNVLIPFVITELILTKLRTKLNIMRFQARVV